MDREEIVRHLAFGIPEAERPKLLIVMTGSIGIVAMPQFLLDLRGRRQFRLTAIVMSSAAHELLPSDTVRAFADCAVYHDKSDRLRDLRVPHIELMREVDLVLVMPATANIVGKAAGGIGDDLVSAILLAAEAPILFVPSMNGSMWRNPFVQENVSRLRERGRRVMEPSMGLEVADLRLTEGGMPSFDEVFQAILRLSKAPRDGVSASSS